MTQERVRVAVIGVGNMGRHHARVYSQIPSAELCAVCDQDLDRAREVAARFGVNAYASYREMLDHERLDAVSVVVPAREHRQIALDLIRSKIHLLVEKPLASNALEGQEIVDAACRAHVLLTVGHQERFNPAVRELRNQIKSGALGQISSVIARRVGVMPPQIRDANVIVDLAVHDIDVLNYIFETKPVVVGATAGTAFLTNRYDHAEIFLKYGNAGCFVQVNWITPLKIRTLSVTGDGGHAELNYVTQRLELFETNVAREYNDFGDFVVRFGEARRLPVEVAVQEPLQLELENFVHAVLGKSDLAVQGQDGLQALVIVGQVMEALARG
jgi:UDP-N-acetylglucosamine 3-dehydrogenase